MRSSLSNWALALKVAELADWTWASRRHCDCLVLLFVYAEFELCKKELEDDSACDLMFL